MEAISTEKKRIYSLEGFNGESKNESERHYTVGVRRYISAGENKI